jgi:hypothetical protein
MNVEAWGSATEQICLSNLDSIRRPPKFAPNKSLSKAGITVVSRMELRASGKLLVCIQARMLGTLYKLSSVFFIVVVRSIYLILFLCPRSYNMEHIILLGISLNLLELLQSQLSNRIFLPETSRGFELVAYESQMYVRSHFPKTVQFVRRPELRTRDGCVGEDESRFCPWPIEL